MHLRVVPAITGGLTRGLTVWRRSVQARVVVSVLVLSAIVVGVVGLLLLRQITGGLVDNRVRVSVAEANSETSVATDRLRQSGTGDFDPATQLRQLVDSLVERGKVRGFEVVVVGPVAGSARGLGSGVGTRTSPDVQASSVPVDLRREVERRPGAAWTFTRIGYGAGGAQRHAPGVVVGNQILLPADGGTYDLYLLFPMTEERDTLGLLRRSLITAGVLLLLLVAGLTWLVTRQVVTPIRLARRVAERISSGRLEERMHVAGEDDIARLGTSFNHMADAMQRQIRQLEELSRVQRQFVSDVSHELRTPLTTVRMAGDVLHDERGQFDPVTARAAELLQEELNRFETLLTDLLEISRFDAGAAVLDLEDVDLVDVVHRVVAATAPLAERRGVHIAVHAEGPCIAEADVRRVERIVRNLLTNAIDHAQRDSAESQDVVVHLAADADAAALTVRDHGVGLLPGDTARVFNRFWRADPARARTTGGTGLGLAISLEDARLHGGQLQAWGRPGEGALFRLTLPREAGEPVPHSPLPLIPADVSSRDPR
ncbi:MAG: MtrAB system histidine kinase MtrB [Marmoricola sp.]